MKKLIATLLLCLTALPSAAQTWFVKAGGGFATQYGAEGYSGVAKIALGYEYEFSQQFTFAPSLGFSGRGWSIADVKTPDMLFDEQGQATGEQRPVLDNEGNVIAGEYMWSMMHRSYTANYIQLDLPLNYYFRMGESRYITITAGPWLACGIAGKRTTEGDGREPGSRKERYTDKTFSLDGAHRFDCGLKAGVGYQFPSSLTVNVEGEFGLLKTNLPTEAFGFRSGRNVALMLTLSYKLNKSKWKAMD